MLKQQLLEQAAQRLAHSISFSRGDPAPHNALGDVLCDAAEIIKGHLTAAAAAGNGGGGGGAASGAGLAEVVALYKRAIDEGYMGALTISRNNTDALVSKGEEEDW